MLGVGELTTRLDEPAPLLFWLPTLWGASALVFIGAFRIRQKPRLAKILILLGSFLGLPASAWTLLMPILILALIVRVLLVPVSSGAKT